METFAVKINNGDGVHFYILEFCLPPPAVGWISVQRLDGLTATGKPK